jgi:hypothetical protein
MNRPWTTWLAFGACADRSGGTPDGTEDLARASDGRGQESSEGEYL